MDLACIDMGCVEKPMKESSIEKEKDNSPKENMMSASKKSYRAKDAMRSSISSLNKLTSQITKPPHRKTSPLNWFPRKRVEPYLKRKIKMLQEVDGMHLTLDETLGDTNPHYCRVLREKIAIREAAEKAMEARKSAMIEASWCRILQAASIDCKEAEAQLSKAEHSAAEAFESARTVGVIMNEIPDSEQIHFKIETISAKAGGGSTIIDTISATFETAFEVDKQVAAAVKAAFIKLASSPSVNKDEFKELLRKISENPDCDENYSNNEFEINTSSIVEMMLDRLRCLKEEELASLATIVATRGLNACLVEAGNVKNTENHSVKVLDRLSVNGRGTAGVELPSLDKFLVKRLSRLEREVLEAKNARKNGDEKLPFKKLEEGPTIPDFGSMLVKHSSKLEKEVEEAKRNNNHKPFEINSKISEKGRTKQDEVPSLDKFLVKKLTRLEREVEEARSKKNSQGKENMDFNHNEVKESSYESLDKVLIKRVSRLEKEKLEFREMGIKSRQKDVSIELEKGEEGSLDQVLVKHKSRLEKEKMAGFEQQENDDSFRHSISRRQAREQEMQATWGGMSLGNSIQPRVSRLEREKAAWIKAEEEERKRAMEGV